MSLFSKLLSLFKNICFPPRCAHCDALGTFLCGNCYNQIDFFAVPPALQLEHVASLTVCGGYDSPLGSLVKELKYHGITEQAHTIAQLMWYACDLPSVEALSYVPMHPRKQNQREYNQTELLAQELARFLKLPVVQYLEKNKHTEALAHTLTKADRLTTIGNSFSIKKNQNPPPYTSILVVDDVITTGATLSTVTALLHELKTDLEIHCLAVAHRS